MGATPARAIDPANLNLITFENRTGQDIRYIFLSPSDSAYWGTDILGSTRRLGDDEEPGFHSHYPDECNEFDIFAIGESDEAFQVFGYEICDGKEAKFRFLRRNLDEEGVDFNFTTVTLENETDYELSYIFFSPGDSVSLLLPVSDETVRYDVRAVDEDEDTYTFFVEIDPFTDEHVYSIESSDLD